MIEQPEHSPSCCGQTAKWVNPTLNLAYFYCSKCKKEVEKGSEDMDISGWGGGTYHTSATPATGLGNYIAPTLPSGSQFKIGDIVNFEHHDRGLTFCTQGMIRAVGLGYLEIQEFHTGTIYTKHPSEVTLVP